MPSAIHYPRAFLNWQARVVGARTAHLYRASHDGRGNWTVTEPGAYKDKPLYFSADDPSFNMGVNDAEGVQRGPPRNAQVLASTDLSLKQVSLRPATSHADQWDAAVRGSHPDFS